MRTKRNRITCIVLMAVLLSGIILSRPIKIRADEIWTYDVVTDAAASAEGESAVAKFAVSAAEFENASETFRRAYIDFFGGQVDADHVHIEGSYPVYEEAMTEYFISDEHTEENWNIVLERYAAAEADRNACVFVYQELSECFEAVQTEYAALDADEKNDVGEKMNEIAAAYSDVEKSYFYIRQTEFSDAVVFYGYEQNQFYLAMHALFWGYGDDEDWETDGDEEYEDEAQDEELSDEEIAERYEKALEDYKACLELRKNLERLYTKVCEKYEMLRRADSGNWMEDHVMQQKESVDEQYEMLPEIHTPEELIPGEEEDDSKRDNPAAAPAYGTGKEHEHRTEHAPLSVGSADDSGGSHPVSENAAPSGRSSAGEEDKRIEKNKSISGTDEETEKENSTVSGGDHENGKETASVVGEEVLSPEATTDGLTDSTDPAVLEKGEASQALPVVLLLAGAGLLVLAASCRRVRQDKKIR